MSVDRRRQFASANDDLDAAVLRFADAGAGAGWYQQMRFAKTLDGDDRLGHPIPDQFGGIGLGPADRQGPVVFRRTGGVGIAVGLDPCGGEFGGCDGRVRDDLAGAVGESGFVPVEKDKIGVGGAEVGTATGAATGGSGAGLWPKL